MQAGGLGDRGGSVLRKSERGTGWTDPRPLFQQVIQVPRSLRALGRALADPLQISGGFGAGGFLFRGVFHYFGT